jgi:drug/metabolite transporter (DMT)-like permease
LTSAFFLGMAPVFGRQAILLGLPPLAVAALRTLFAALLLLGLMAIFSRKYLYIYPAGLLGCLLAGLINGLGSLFYYSALGRIEASVGQLLYSLYPLFLVVWLALDRQTPSRLTLVRLVLALPAIILLTQTGRGATDWLGILQMLVAAALYALHLPINQRVLFDMPAPTVTVYTLLAMSAVVVPAYLLSGFEVRALQSASIWPPLFGLTLATFLSRLTLFQGVKRLGGMQTALLGLSEVLVTVFFAHLWLGERLSSLQWLGAMLLIAALLLVLKEKSPPRKHNSGDMDAKSKKPGW